MSFDNKGDKRDVSIRETESTPLLVDVNSFNNTTSEENSDTNINDGPNARMMIMITFPSLSQTQRSRKQSLQQVSSNLKHLSLSPLQNGLSFSRNYYYSVTQSGLKLRRYCYFIRQA